MLFHNQKQQDFKQFVFKVSLYSITPSLFNERTTQDNVMRNTFIHAEVKRSPFL